HPSEEPGDVIGRWLTWLHMVVVFGVTLQIVVCVAGLAIVGLTGTGVYIWVVKRNAHRIARSRMTPPLHTS
ncbi:MAG TPA: PepSY-associated TM helix domain-containing protein, partial [Candidatus Acidoferrum sp.]|nr:PepSY-associated TM helix domain-containing protein [Candidatus Acidoferrum sp.]